MPGTILITPAVLGVVEGYVQVTSLGPVAIKGLSTPMAAYEVTGAGLVRTRLQAAAVQGLTRFVGRDRELDHLHRALDQAGSDHGQVMALVGEPGVGKSRLFWEFTHAHRIQGWLRLESRAVSYGEATPYLPVIDLLKAYCGVDSHDDTRRVHEKVTGKLLTLDRTLEPTLPALLTLLDVPVEDAAWQALDPRQRRRHTLEAVKRLLLRESQVRPVLVVFEDLHWIDTETQAVLDRLVDSLPTARVVLLVNYRPDYQHGWGSKTSYSQLRLDPLPAASAEALLQTLLGHDASLEPLRPRVIAQTQGNPFFLEESVRTLVETGMLVGERRAYRLEKPLDTWQIPATVQALLAARIDRLPPEDKRLLQTAAVIGTAVPWPLLQAIADTSEEALYRGLEQLQAAEFLYEASLFPERAYTFKHALTHEVAYGGLLQERRRTLHARIVEALEALIGDRVAEQVERLAHHALRGEVWDKALAYGREAGEKALAQSANREAAGHYEQALSALQHLPDRRDTREQAIDLRLALRTALRPLGEFGRILVALREAESLAAALNDHRRLGQVSLHLAVHFGLMGAHDQAMAAAQRALALAMAGGDVVQQALANLRLGRAYVGQDDYRRAVDYLKPAVAFFDGARGRERFGFPNLPAVISRGWLAQCYTELGTFAEGRAVGAEGLRIAEAVAHPGSLMVACHGLGLLALRQGDLSRVLPWLERAVGICHEADPPAHFPGMAALLGAAYTLAGRVADAVPPLTQAIEQTMVKAMVDEQVLCRLSLGEAQLLAGQLEDARALAEQALTLARERQERGNQAYALRFSGRSPHGASPQRLC